MELFETYRQMLDGVEPLGVSGQVTAARGLTVSVGDFPAPLGAACRILRRAGGIEARVIGFAGRETLIMPLGNTQGIARGDRVIFISSRQSVPVGTGMLGRVINAFGRCIDGGADIEPECHMPLWPDALPAMQRRRISDALGTGIRAVDSMLTIGKGQRMGIFSGSGVGKSVLMGMISRYTSADVTVIALVGERGREVKDFIERDLGSEGLRRAVVVASTSDEPPLARVQASAVATAIAEFFRDRGCDVLLLMDSLTRLALAQRQIGLAAGEPPATKGYTPSVFDLMPRLLERCGPTADGSITGFYTVLVEGDDMADPVADAARSVTDGHIVLSRELANRGQYPAIDMLASVSRVMSDISAQEHRTAAREVHRLMALYSEIEDMVTIGAYCTGASAEHDLAIKAMPAIRDFLAQAVQERASLDDNLQALLDLSRKISGMRRLAASPAATLRPATVGRNENWVKQ